MAQRISRAKQRIQDAGSDVRDARAEPSGPSGCGVVLHVLYLIFNEGYTASSGPTCSAPTSPPRRSASPGSVHRLLPDDGEVAGLLALCCSPTPAARPAPAPTAR